jgi:hypothetical protein
MQRILRLSLGLTMLAAALGAGPAGAAEIVSHRAEYKYFLEPNDTRAGGSIEENRVTCKAWVQTTRHRLSGPNLVPSSQRMEITELRDGRGMTFLHRLSTGGKSVVSLEGSAQRRGDGKPLIASYTSPEVKSEPLPPGTVFITAFYFRALRELRAAPNKTIKRTPVFGLLVHGANRYASLSYVEARRAKDGEPLLAPVEGDTELLDSPSMDIELRIFASRDAVTPAQRIVATVHDNGVYSRAVYYLPRMTFTAELSRIEALPKPKC